MCGECVWGGVKCYYFVGSILGAGGKFWGECWGGASA